MMNPLKEDEARTLGTMLAEHEKVLQDAYEIVKREQPIVENLRRTVASLMGKPPKDSWGFVPAALDRYQPSRATTFLINQNPSQGAPEAVPKRKPEYAQLTHIQSVVKAMVALVPDGTPIHVDEIVRETYFPIPDRDVFYRIKRTVVSEILRGMEKHLFARGKKPNTFGLVLRNKPAQAQA